MRECTALCPPNNTDAIAGTNGAGKTTTISILTGMLKPTSGTAFVDGQSIQEGMSAIRQNLGVCPQFDILWPDLTVREHLELYAAIKGYSKTAGKSVAASSAKEVGESFAAIRRFLLRSRLDYQLVIGLVLLRRFLLLGRFQRGIVLLIYRAR